MVTVMQTRRAGAPPVEATVGGARATVARI